jgi:DNA-binding HxlR family transcriptional regulator
MAKRSAEVKMSAETRRSAEESLIKVFSLLGKRWSGRILAALMEGPVRFADLRRSVSGISESMLSQRLGELIDEGLVRREIIEGPPLGSAYQLTESGMALRPALQELIRWSGTHLESVVRSDGSL